MKERNFIIEITKFDAGYFLNRLWRQIRVWGHLVLNPVYTKMIVTCHDILDLLDTRDSQWQNLTNLAFSKTRQVSDIDV